MSDYNGFQPIWSQVAENLWFGGTPEAGGGLHGRFRYIVDCVGGKYQQVIGRNVAIVRAPFPDSVVELPALALVTALAEFAIAGMKQGPTLVHCQQGHNRSGLITAFALVRAGLRDKRDVVRFLRERRKPEVLANSAFVAMIEGMH